MPTDVSYDLMLLESLPNEVVHLIDGLKTENIVIDVLINCAALQFTPKLTDKNFSFDGIEIEITTNFTSVIWLTHLLLANLITRPQSAIVNLSSGLAFYPKSGSAVYCATKSAIHSFSQSLRYQLANKSVQVTEVLLPMVDTPMTVGRGTGKISPESAARAIIQGLQKDRDEIYVEKARLLPFMIRLWPGFVKRLMSKY